MCFHKIIDHGYFIMTAISKTNFKQTKFFGHMLENEKEKKKEEEA